MEKKHSEESALAVPLSILVPIRNGMPYLESFKENISLAAGSQDQIILVNDNSEDSTYEFLMNWRAADPRVLLLQSPGAGLVAALNFGLRKAKFDWIARIDVDDYCSQDRFFCQRQFLDSDVSAVFCDYRFFRGDSLNLGIVYSPVFHDATVLSLVQNQRTPHPGVVFNKALAIKVGAYRELDFPSEDLSLWLRLSEVGEVISVPRILLEYRISPGSISAINRAKAIEKRSSLIQNNSVLDKALLNSIANLGQTILKYGDIDDSSARKALHIRELIIASRIYRRKAKLFRALTTQVKISSYFALLPSVIQMQKERLIRKHRRL